VVARAEAVTASAEEKKNEQDDENVHGVKGGMLSQERW
jgi:hypothetical protein